MLVAQFQTLVLTRSGTLALGPLLALSLSFNTRKTPSTYVYTSFVSYLVLVKFEAVGKMACCTGNILHGHVAIITKQVHTTTNQVHHFQSTT